MNFSASLRFVHFVIDTVYDMIYTQTCFFFVNPRGTLTQVLEHSVVGAIYGIDPIVGTRAQLR